MGVLYDLAQLAKKNDVRARIIMRTMLFSNLANFSLQKQHRLNHAKHASAASVLDTAALDVVQSKPFAKKSF
jgi:hypothetical protein